MGHRLSKIYTKTGDQGTTGLGDGTRVAKSHWRVQLMGHLDELNSHIGVVRAHEPRADIDEMMLRIQHEIFNAGGEIAVPEMTLITANHVTQLEQDLDGLNADLPPLKEFILQGGNMVAAQCFLARAVCRRAEREAFAEDSEVREALRQYLNRLSDLLFVMARCLARENGGQEITWQH